MIFKKISMEFAQYGEDDIKEMQDALLQSCQISQGPFGDLAKPKGVDSVDEDSSQMIAKKKKGRGRFVYGRD